MEKELIQKKSIEILDSVDDEPVFIQSLHELFTSLVDEKTSKNYKRLIVDTGKFYGVPKPSLWIIAAEIRKYILKYPNKAANLLAVLWGEGSYEARQIAGKSVEKFGPKNQKITLDFIKSALPDINNWSICDSLSIYAVEPILLSDEQPVLTLSKDCVKDPNKWIRRFGVVSLRGYRKLDLTDDFYEILETVKNDDERDVKKSVAWILRVVTPMHHDEVLKILTVWAESDPDKNTKFIIKEGMKKLTDEEQFELTGLIKG